MRIHTIFLHLVILWSTFSNGQDTPHRLISDILSLGESELVPIDVTKRESEVRSITFTSATIFSSPAITDLYPLIIYTAPLGTINTKFYDEIKDKLREVGSNPDSEPSNTMGFILEEEGEAFVFLDGVKIASNDPPTPDDPMPWQARRQTGISIIGSLKSKNMDFHIFVIGPSTKTAELLPNYKRFFEAPLNFRDFGRELFTAVQDAKFLESKAIPSQRQPKTRCASGVDNPGKTSSKVGTRPALSGKGWREVFYNSTFWLWIIMTTAIALPLLLLALRRAKR